MGHVRISERFWHRSLRSLAVVAAALSLGILSVGPVSHADASPAVAAPVTTQPVTDAATVAKWYQEKTALQLAQLVRKGTVTSTQLVDAALAKIKADNPALNAVISLREQDALNDAATIKDTGQPFYGVPILIKGLGQPMAGLPNTNGLAFAPQTPEKFTGAFVAKIEAAGFIVLGQTNFPELGLINITDSKLNGPAHTPWNPDYNTGGSSGGAGAAVADGMVPVATGNDAGGSIRIPAAWNGEIGLKPTQAFLVGNSNSATAYTENFALTRSMADMQQLFTFMENPTDHLNGQSLKGMTIAYTTQSPVGTPVSQDAKNAVANAVAFLRQQGFTVKAVPSPIDGVQLMKSYYTLGASSMQILDYLSSTQQKRPLQRDDVGLLTWGLYQAGKHVTKDDVAAAWQVINDDRAKLATYHQTYPLTLTPTTAWTAPKVGDSEMTPEDAAKMEKIDTLTPAEQMQLIYDQWLPALTRTPFTQQANLSGDPAISLPTYVAANGLPLGIQFEAAPGNDDVLMQLGQLFEDHGQFKMLADPAESATGTPLPTPTAPTVPSTPAKQPTPVAKQPTVTKLQRAQQQAKRLNKQWRHKHIRIKRGLYRYQHATFKRSERLAHLRPTAQRRTYSILGVTTSSAGRLRLHIAGGYVTADKQYIQIVK